MDRVFAKYQVWVGVWVRRCATGVWGCWGRCVWDPAFAQYLVWVWGSVPLGWGWGLVVRGMQRGAVG